MIRMKGRIGGENECREERSNDILAPAPFWRDSGGGRLGGRKGAMLQSKRLSSQPQLVRATSAAPLARGAKGDGVATAQGVLVDLGYNLPHTMAQGAPDGIFGPETDAAVKQFQLSHGLKPDGYVGPLTLAAMDRLILANPLVLETVDLVSEKAQMLRDAAMPLGARRSAYY
jgi:peptidoglycan hydrolase-like protein with peptidoglycan-binding domain